MSQDADDSKTPQTPTAAAASMKPATPLPWKKLAALLLVLMNESVSASMLFPFIGFFVAHLTGRVKEQAGYTSGLLLAMFMIGQFLSGKVWGRMSDLYGRRPVMLFALFMSAIAVILFGLSTSLLQAMLFRFFHGLVNGNIAICKVVVTELTDKTNESKGFAVISMAWCVGCLFGPFMGGFLYDPAHSGKFDWIGADKSETLAAYPALLPCIAVAVYSLSAMTAGLVVLPETNRKAKPLLHLWARLFPGTVDSIETASPPGSPTSPGPSSPDATVRFGYRQVFASPSLRKAVLLYVALCGADFGFNELFPLWAITSLQSGGLDLTAPDIGLITVVSGASGIAANALFPFALHRTGCRLRFWQMSTMLSAVVFVAIPFAPAYMDCSTAIVVVVVLQLFRMLLLSWAFSTVFLFVAAVAPVEHLGAVNGIAQSCGCMLRALVPMLFTPLFALSIEHPVPYVFGFYTAFLLCAAMLCYGYYLSIGFVVAPREVQEEEEEMAEGPVGVCCSAVGPQPSKAPSTGGTPSGGSFAAGVTATEQAARHLLLSTDDGPMSQTVVEMSMHTLHPVEGETSPTVPHRRAEY